MWYLYDSAAEIHSEQVNASNEGLNATRSDLEAAGSSQAAAGSSQAAAGSSQVIAGSLKQETLSQDDDQVDKWFITIFSMKNWFSTR